MIISNKAILLGAAALVTLAACEPVAPFDPNDPNRNARRGALTGAAIGAAAGLATGDDATERRQQATIGAIAGATAGGVIGNRLDRQAAELRSGFSSNAIDVVNTGEELIVRMPQDILFATDSASVAPALRSDLGVLAGSLNRYPNSTVQVVGHTDNTGSAAYNQDLSERRARSVTSILAGSGVSQGRLRAFGAGEDQPIASNLDAAGRAQNRRVEITISPTA